jgi:hypothetical protein
MTYEQWIEMCDRLERAEVAKMLKFGPAALMAPTPPEILAEWVDRFRQWGEVLPRV